MYQERPSTLPGAVVWSGSDNRPGSVQRVLPDGCMDLLWAEGGLLVAGPDTSAHLATVPAGTGYVGLRFAPGAGPAVLGVPASALRDLRVPLQDVWPLALVRRLVGLIDGAADAADRGAALERIAQARDGPDPLVARIVACVRAGRGIASIAGEVDLSARQLHRRCLAAFGYGAKTLARILRMNRAVAAAHTGVPFATVAAVCGYADQAHLARDVKDLAGVPLGSLIR